MGAARRGRTKSAAFVAVTTALGWAGSAAICAGGVLLSYQGKAPDRAVQVQLLRDFNSGHSAFVFLLCVFAAIGYVVLAVEPRPQRPGRQGRRVLIGLGGVGTLMTMPGPLKALLVFAALVLLAGQTLVLRGVGIETTEVHAPEWEPTAAQS